MVLKRKLARRSWPIEAVVEAVWRSHGSDSLGRHRGFPIGLKYAWIWLQSGLKKTTFSATIGSRSGHDHGLIMTLSRRRSPADRGETNPRRSRAGISSIAARSRRDRGSIGLRSWSSSMMFRLRPMKRQENGRSDRDQAASLFDDDPTLLASPRGVR